MGYAILWLTSMAAALQLSAIGARLGARIERGLSRWLIPVAFDLASLVFGLEALWLSVVLESWNVRASWVWYTTSWNLVFVVGACLLQIAGLHRGRSGRGLAAEWPGRTLASGAGVAVLICALTYVRMDTLAMARLHDIRTDATTLNCMNTPAPVPMHLNAAPLYERAFETMPDYERWPTGSWAVAEGWAEEADAMPPSVEEFVLGQRRTIELLHAAAARDRYYVEPMMAPMPACVPRMMGFSLASRLLAMEALRQAQHGDTSAAVAEVGTMIRVACHLTQCRSVAGVVFASAVRANAVCALERILACDGLRSEALVDLARESLHGSDDSMRVVLNRSYAEQLYSLVDPETSATAVMSAAAADAAVSDVSHALELGLPGVGTLAPGYRRLHRLMHTPSLVRVFQLDASLVDVTLFEQVCARHARRGSYADLLGSVVDLAAVPPGGVADVTRDNAFLSIRSLATAQALSDLARLAAAAAAFRIDHGGYPRDPEALVPAYIDAVPLDPFDGTSLRARIDGDGMTLYSVGEDGDDDGGSPPDRSMSIDEFFPQHARGHVRLYDGDLVFYLGDAYVEHRRAPRRVRGGP